jgi:ArsR family transcriptional regulator, arsenate/arsenite/antimonite-responsive transcriptional repressor
MGVRWSSERRYWSIEARVTRFERLGWSFGRRSHSPIWTFVPDSSVNKNCRFDVHGYVGESMVRGGRMLDVRTALAELILPQASPLNGEVYDRIDAERLAGVLKALADPARLRLLSLIQASPDGEACVCDLTAPIGLSQPTVSHHLRILTESGLLEREKRGVWAYYRLVPSAIQAIADLLTPPRKRATKKAR